MGRAVPGLFPLKAWSTDMPAVPVLMLLPGRTNPVVGRPELDIGRMLPSAVVMGLGADREVPGLGIEAIALESRSSSPTPSASSSVSSMYASVACRAILD